MDEVWHTASISRDTLALEGTLGPKTSNKLTSQVAGVKPEYYQPGGWPSSSPLHILQQVHDDAREDCKEILYSSIGDGPSNSGKSSIIPDTQGLVSTVMRAYGGHFHLEIRPDDVWISSFPGLLVLTRSDSAASLLPSLTKKTLL